jgi:hypothetical protein
MRCCSRVHHRRRYGRKSAEVFDEALDLWLRLPRDLPVDGELYCMGSTLL